MPFRHAFGMAMASAHGHGYGHGFGHESACGTNEDIFKKGGIFLLRGGWDWS